MSVLLNPYISFRGEARQAMELYRSVFGGELQVMTFADVPGMAIEPGDADKVMHSMLTGENGIVLMAADTPAGMEHTPFNGSISLSGDDERLLRTYWEALTDGGTVAEPLVQAPWGDTFGMCADRFGIRWMVNIAASPPQQ